MQGCEFVFHLAANADVRFGTDHPRRDLEQNTIVTFNVLEAMRAAGIRRIAFSSTGSIYGEPDVFPTPETAPFPVQTSLYGASKLAGEALIQAYCEGFGFQGLIFRFVSILGERYSHGHVFDFYRSLRSNRANCGCSATACSASRTSTSRIASTRCSWRSIGAGASVSIFNLGTDEYCQVNDSIGWIVGHLGIEPARTYTGGERGWIGDSPFIFLDTSKIRALGWRPKVSIREGIIKTLDYLRANTWLMDERS